MAEVPKQLAVFADPARAQRRMSHTLGHVERHDWGAVAVVPWQGGRWTVAAFLGSPGRCARVASGYAERAIAGVPVGNFPIAALVALAVLGLGSMVVPITALVLVLVLGFLVGLPVAGVYRQFERRMVTGVELDDDLRLFLVDEREGLLSAATVGRLLKAAARGGREELVLAARRTHELLGLARGCPDEQAIRGSVVALLDELAGDPVELWPATRAAMEELLDAVRAWRRSREELLARAEEPVRSRRRRDGREREQRRQEAAQVKVRDVVSALRSEAEVQQAAADELD